MNNLIIGGHYNSIFSFDELKNIIIFNNKIDGNIIQIFIGKNTSTTTSTTQKPHFTVDEFNETKKLMKKYNTDIYIHASLSINLANPYQHQYKWALDNLIYDMKFGNKIGAKAIIVHVGSSFIERYNNPVIDQAYKNMAKNIDYALKEVGRIKIFIETSSAIINSVERKNNKIAVSIQDLSKLYNLIHNKKRTKICIDTCHIFASGYDISGEDGWNNYIKLFGKYIGIKNIGLIHLNDSIGKYMSGRDLHISLMKGEIFKGNKKVLIGIVKWIHEHKIPIILETRNLKRYSYEIHFLRKSVVKK